MWMYFGDAITHRWRAPRASATTLWISLHVPEIASRCLRTVLHSVQPRSTPFKTANLYTTCPKKPCALKQSFTAIFLPCPPPPFPICTLVVERTPPCHGLGEAAKWRQAWTASTSPLPHCSTTGRGTHKHNMVHNRGQRLTTTYSWSTTTGRLTPKAGMKFGGYFLLPDADSPVDYGPPSIVLCSWR